MWIFKGQILRKDIGSHDVTTMDIDHRDKKRYNKREDLDRSVFPFHFKIHLVHSQPFVSIEEGEPDIQYFLFC